MAEAEPTLPNDSLLANDNTNATSQNDQMSNLKRISFKKGQKMSLVRNRSVNSKRVALTWSDVSVESAKSEPKQRASFLSRLKFNKLTNKNKEDEEVALVKQRKRILDKSEYSLCNYIYFEDF